MLFFFLQITLAFLQYDGDIKLLSQKVWSLSLESALAAWEPELAVVSLQLNCKCQNLLQKVRMSHNRENDIKEKRECIYSQCLMLHFRTGPRPQGLCQDLGISSSKGPWVHFVLQLYEWMT